MIAKYLTAEQKKQFQKVRKGFKYVRKALNLAASLSDSIPSKKDTPIQVAFKAMSIGSIALSFLDDGKASSEEFDTYREKYRISERTANKVLALMLSSINFPDSQVTDIKLDSETYLEIRDEHNQPILLNAMRSAIYHQKGHDLTSLSDQCWNHYEGKLLVTRDKHGSIFVSGFAEISNPLFGDSSQRLERLVTKHRRYTAAGVPRTYMFYGPPGTGKTSQAMVFGDRMGGRILRMDADIFSGMPEYQIMVMLDIFKPDIFLVDDIDKVASGNTPQLLSVIQEIKLRKQVCLILTCNSVKEFDKGFLRPNRIDTWVKFELPNEEERRIILQNYLKADGQEIEDSYLNTLASETEGLTQDYLREIAQQVKFELQEDLLDRIEMMKELLLGTKGKKRNPSNASESETIDWIVEPRPVSNICLGSSSSDDSSGQKSDSATSRGDYIESDVA